MRNFLIIILGVLLLNAALLYSGGFSYLKSKIAPEEVVTKSNTQVKNDVYEVFRITVESEIQKQKGTPIEGYTPDMFLAVFPGLTASDFNGVEASVGKYVLADGRLEHKMDTSKLTHSAATAVTRVGMRTLFKNIANRLEINLDAKGTLTEVMEAITKE